MSTGNLVSLVTIIFFVYSAAFGKETFLENRAAPILQSTTKQQTTPLWFSLVENPVVPLLQNTTVSTQQVIENGKDIPIDGVFFNSCCDENVRVSGTAHILVNRNVIHIVVSDMTATGLESGYSYTGRGTSVENIVFYSQAEGSFNFRLNLTNENGCGFMLKLLFHLTVNENGEVTSEVENVNVFCLS